MASMVDVSGSGAMIRPGLRFDVARCSAKCGWTFMAAACAAGYAGPLNMLIWVLATMVSYSLLKGLRTIMQPAKIGIIPREKR